MSRKTITKQTAGAERALLEYMNRKDYRPMPQRELLHRTHVTPQDRPAVRRLIRRLIDEGKIRKVGGGRLTVCPAEDGVRGILHRHREGFGLVVPESGGEDVFLAPGNQGRAGSGDHVALRVIGRSDTSSVRSIPWLWRSTARVWNVAPVLQTPIVSVSACAVPAGSADNMARL